MVSAVALLKSQGTTDNNVIFVVAHGVPIAPDEYPCYPLSLGQFTEVDATVAMVVVGEDTADELDALNCTDREQSVYGYSSDIVHFNETYQFFRDLPSIQYLFDVP